ncbi:MAG: hypothetical protein R3324_07050, partial [Halobacteriales archaeon]|nr:hypothetical protein [Halobacteriales archaeon]
TYVAEIQRRLSNDRDRLAVALRFEEAADRQRRLGWLQQLESFRSQLERPALDRSWLLLLPAASERRRVLVPVAKGRVLGRRELEWHGPTRETAVRDACYAVRVAELRVEPVFPPEELVPSLIVTRWIDSGAEEGIRLDLDRLDTEEVIRRTFPDRSAG